MTTKTKDKIINPKTGRKVTIGGRLYKKLVKEGIIDRNDFIRNKRVEKLDKKSEKKEKSENPERTIKSDFSLGDYIFNLYDLYPLILDRLNAKELWNVRSLNQGVYRYCIDKIVKGILEQPIKQDWHPNIYQLSMEFYLLKGGEELESFLVKIEKIYKYGMTTRIIIELYNKLHYRLFYKGRSRNEIEDLRQLNIKYNSFEKHNSVLYSFDDEKDLRKSFKCGLHPIHALIKAININVCDDLYFDILTACKHNFDQDVFQLSRKEVKELLKKFY